MSTGRAGRAPSRLGVFGPVSLAVAVGIQLTFTSLLWLPLPHRPPLTTMGTFYFKPEWDGRVYLLGGVLAVGLSVLFARRARGRTVLPGSAQVAVAVTTTVLHLAVFLEVRHRLGQWPTCWPLTCARLPETAPPGGSPGVTATVAMVAMTVLCLTAALVRRPGPGPGPAPPADRMRPDRSPPAGERTRWQALDLVFPLLLVAIVYVPSWRHIAGQTFDLDGLFHWDYFAMGPTLAFRHGAALSSDVHTFYGVGWPLLFSALSPILSVSYDHMVLVAVIAGCAYMVGAYLFLRVLLRSPWWAAVGSGLVLAIHVFGRDADALSPYWGFPSATVIRSTFDVWCLLALVVHHRSGKRGWAVAAGGLGGLALLFELDTGLYLAVAVACFMAGSLWIAADRRTALRAAVATAAGGATVVLAGLAVASRGTLVHLRFWSSWLENLRTTSAGFSMEPLLSLPPGRSIVVLALMMATYLTVIGCVLVGVARRRADSTRLAIGALAVYGYLTTLYFVGRSSPFYLPRASVPFALLLASLAAMAHARVDPTGPAWPRLHRLAPALSSGLVAALVVTNPLFRNYPGVLGAAAGAGQPVSTPCLMASPDVCGLRTTTPDSVRDFREIAGRMRALAPGPGGTVAVLDYSGPTFNLASRTAPWGRYYPLLFALFTPEKLESVQAAFRAHPPDAVVMRREDVPLFADVSGPLRPLVAEAFVLDREVGAFEIWRRR